jgi:hypothetical protein
MQKKNSRFTPNATRDTSLFIGKSANALRTGINAIGVRDLAFLAVLGSVLLPSSHAQDAVRTRLLRFSDPELRAKNVMVQREPGSRGAQTARARVFLQNG